MSCKDFLQCLSSLKTSTIEKKEKGRKKKQIEITGFPCSNAIQKEKCICFFDDRTHPKCEENGKVYVIDKGGSSFPVLCFHIDDGVVSKKDNNSRCDFAMFLNDGVDSGRGRAVFIELKGSDTKQALEQLLATLKNESFSGVSKSYKRIYGRIANSASIPKIKNTGQYVDLEEYLIAHGGNLKTGEWRFEEKYSEMDSR